MRQLLAAALSTVVLTGAAAGASEYPERPAGPVLDQAQVIPEVAERALDSRLRAYFLETCRAVIVATVSSLKGQTIDKYATNLGNEWKIGDPIRGDGVLLLVAPSERKVRIEVSRSLQPAMPDAAAASIIQGGMMDRYRAGDYAGGIQLGIEAIETRLDRDAPENPTCRPAQRGAK